jgi:hypothetical protein
MKSLETRKERTKALKLVTAQINELEKSKLAAIKVLVVELKERQSVLSKNHQWLFNFVGGGWNSSFGMDKEEAIKAAIKEYGKGVDTKSFRISTESEERALLSLFY